jgi:short-subunit dehydrogenase
MATYYASKAFVLSFSEALADEVSGTGVVVTALCPGPTETGFADAAGVGSTPLFRSGAMDADAVARAGYDGLMKGRRIVIPGLKNRLLALTGRLSPEWIKLQVTRRLNGEPG